MKTGIYYSCGFKGKEVIRIPEYQYKGKRYVRNERFAYMTALITADETQVEACREFIRKH